MGKVLITESYLTDIANAIREKNSGASKYTPPEMAAAIKAITTSSVSGSGQWKVNVTQVEHQTISYTAGSTVQDDGNNLYTPILTVTPKIKADSGYFPGEAVVTTDKDHLTVSITATAATESGSSGSMTQVASWSIHPDSSGSLTGYTLTRSGAVIPNKKKAHFRITLFCPTGISANNFEISDFASGRTWGAKNSYCTTPTEKDVTAGKNYVLEWDELISVADKDFVSDDDKAKGLVNYYVCSEMGVTGDSTKYANTTLSFEVFSYE